MSTQGRMVVGLNTRGEQPKELLKEVARRSVVLTILAVPVLAACWRVNGGRPLGWLAFGLYVAAAGLLVACEHWLPFEHRWGSAIQGSRTDFLYVIVASAMDKAMFVVCVTTIAAIGGVLAARFQISAWPTSWSLGFQIAAALLVADVAAYLRHRAFHRSDLLWRFH